MPTRDRQSPLDETTLLLWAARRTGVLDALMESAGTPAEVAEAAGVTERAARVTVRRLAAEGFLERVGDAYEPTNRALGFLAKRDVRSIGRLPHRLDLLDALVALPETMRTGAPPDLPADWTRNRLGALAATDEATVRAYVTAATRSHPTPCRVLVVGGAPGLVAREFAARGHDVTLFDEADAVDVIRPFLSPTDVSLATGDPVESLPSGFDLVVAVDVTHALGPDANRSLVRNAHDALGADGTFVVVDALRGRSDRARTLDVELLARTPAGEPYPADRYREWFDAAGFDDVSVSDVPGTDRQSVVGRRAID